MTKAKRQMLEDLKLIDLVIELLDARIPYSSSNPDIGEMAKGRSRMILLNKSDMADGKYNLLWKEHFEKKGCYVCVVNSLDRRTLKQINAKVQEACAEKIQRDLKRGIRNRPVRAMVTGIPNVGKSTFINSFSGKASAKTGNKPGVTRGKQWIRLSSTLELLDTPGILWPKFDDQSVGLKLALTGSIKDEIMNTEELAQELIKLLHGLYPGAVSSYYDLSSNAQCLKNGSLAYGQGEIALELAGKSAQAPSMDGDIKGMIGETQAVVVENILAEIALARGCIGKGGIPDLLRTAGMVLENFRNGKMGSFTLDRP